MKKNKINFYSKVLHLFLLAFTLLIVSCSKEMIDISKPTEPTGNTHKSAVICETPLIAAQNYTAGAVTATFNVAGNQLTITYSTLNTDYCLVETHLDVQADPANFPQTKSGNPKVGQFAYGATLGCATGWTQVVDLTAVTGWLPGAYVYMAAHAVVKKTTGENETAWGQGLPFPGNNWAMYFSCQQPVFVCGNPFTDGRDGKTYNTVQIGTQCWMAQNLNVGTRIDGASTQTDNSVIEKYCYNNLESNCDIYGGLYQWDEAMQYVTTEGVQGICPNGWHLPAMAAWTTLNTYLGESNVGCQTKEAGLTHWKTPNNCATNSSGFTGLPGGYRGTSGSFFRLTELASFRLSSQYDASKSWYMWLEYRFSFLDISTLPKAVGMSARCLQD